MAQNQLVSLFKIYIFKVFEDFNLEYPSIKNLLHGWTTFMKKWTYFSNNLLSLRRNSVKDNYGKDLLKQLDAVQLSGSEYKI